MFGSIYRKISKSFYGTGASKIPLVKNVHSSIVGHTAPEFVTVFGYKMFLDQHDEAGHSVILDSENEEMKILKKLIHVGDTVIDIGANIGFYTLLFRSIVGKTGNVISFEPEPKNFALLKKTISVNKFENVNIYQKAVGNKNSKTKIKLSDKIGSHQISNTGDIEIDCIRLDDYINSADFVKLDVEGYEIEVLKGMPNLLRQKISLMSEFQIKLLKNHSNPIEFFNILNENGFSFNDMRDNMSPISESDFMLNYNGESVATDILCTRNS